MKKFGVFVLLIIFSGSMIFMGIGCKEPEVVVETVVETVIVTEEVPVDEVPEGATIITWWDWNGGSWAAALDPIFEEYHRLHPDVYIYRNGNIPWGTYNAELKASLAGGTAADIIGYEAGPQIASLIEAEQVLELTPLIMNDEEWKGWLWKALEHSDMWVGDKIYQSPVNANSIVMIYHKDMLESRGLEPPTTLEELTEISKVFNAEGITTLASDFVDMWPSVVFFMDLVWAADENIFNDLNKGEGTWTAPVIKEAFEAIVKLHEDKVLNQNILEYDSGVMINEFNAKKTAMMFPFGSFWVLAMDEDLLANDELGLIPLPKMHADDRPVVTSALALMFVNANSKNAEVAADILKFNASPFAQEKWFDASLVPIGDAVTKSSGIPLFDACVEIQNNSIAVHRRINDPEVNVAVQDGIASALLGKDIDEILEKIDRISKEAYQK